MVSFQTANTICVTQKKGDCSMDFYQIPIDFSMALAMIEPAMNAYSAMTEAQKQAVLNRARNARSEAEMHQIVASLTNW